jgi:hypothetical protein
VAKVATAVNAGRYVQVEDILDAATPFAKTSNALSVSFMQLRKAAEI